MPASRKQFRRRRKRLFEKQGGKCHYCQCDMVHMWKVAPNKANGKIPNLCTIEHLRDRFDPTRREPNHNREQRWVAACWKCNNERNKEREREQPIKELWRRAGHLTRMMEQVDACDMEASHALDRDETRANQGSGV